jgi:ribosomal protein S6--L-glutamate ligase
LDTLRFSIDLSGDEPDLQFRGKPLSDYDAILPRIGASITYFGTAVVRQFEQMDVYTPNTANGIANSRDKLRATQDSLPTRYRYTGHGVRAQPG